MTDTTLKMALAFCLWVIVYHHLVYPALLAQLGKWRRGQRRNVSNTAVLQKEWPTVTIIIPAYNEGAFIIDKIRNLAEITYPRDRLEIVIAIDGCTDQTLSKAESAIRLFCMDINVKAINYPRNIGKIAVVNDRIAAATTEIIALSDASAVFEADALERAAMLFSEADVAVVFATYRLREAGSEGERAYTKFQTELKHNEAALDSPMGGHGALYFVRRSCWEPMPPDTINDDFILPMQMIAKGARGVYDPTIVATELERTQTRQEFRRRIRIGAGNMQQAIRLFRLANPRRPWLAFMFLSGKGARPFIPFIFLIAIGLTAILAARGEWLYRLLLLAELLILALGCAVIATRSSSTPKILAWLGYLIEGHFASLVGALHILGGLTLKGWQQPTKSAVRSS